MSRWPGVVGCDNLRDVGGYRTEHGRSVRWNRIYRSGALPWFTDATVDWAKRSGVRTVVDLRTSSEIDAAGGARPPDTWAARVVGIPTDNPPIDALRRARATDVGELYLWNLDQKAAGFVKILELLKDADNLPCVVQCKSGKDRTGLVIALILDLLGVPNDAIAAEYALTEEAFLRRPTDRREADAGQMAAAGIDPEILHTRAETMHVFLREFRNRYGNATNYARLAGVDDGVITAVRANLLKDAELSDR